MASRLYNKGDKLSLSTEKLSLSIENEVFFADKLGLSHMARRLYNKADKLSVS